MFESKYGKVLTVLLILVIIAILGLIGFITYEVIQNNVITKDASNYVDNFQGEVKNESNNTNSTNTPVIDENPFNQIENTSTNNTGTEGVKQYKGFGVIGTMEIPKISLKYPILEKMTTKSLETSIVFLFGTGINNPGNTVISGHNYRNGAFFSNNKKLNVGDKIYITDTNGKKLTYTIYNKFVTSDTDTSFYQRDTGGKAEVTLSTCTDDGRDRLIILAKED